MITVGAKDQNIRHLITDYIETLALFISNINEVSTEIFKSDYRNSSLKW
jgi:hypothetical protein